MLPTVRIRGYWRTGPLLLLSCQLVSCQLVSGLGELEVVDGTGGSLGSGGASSSGGSGSGGSANASCVVGWQGHACQGQCGDTDDGIHVGCGNFMACYVSENCLPADCSQNVDDSCGINKIQGGTALSLAMAQEVVTCLCYPTQ